MIRLHKLNGDPITVNAELIQLVESLPDTVITFTDQRRLLVAETVEDVTEAALEYRRRIQQFTDEPLAARA